MDIQSMLFGRRNLVVNPALLERQLLQEIDGREASRLTGLALGFDTTLFANPMAAALVVDQYAPALAAMAGQMRAILVMCAEREVMEDEPIEHHERETALAKSTIAIFDQVYRLAGTMPPMTSIELRDQSGRTVTHDDNLPSLDEILAETGGPVAPEELTEARS